MRGLLMIEPLYKQTVCGHKTMTRRTGGLDIVNENPDNWEITGGTGDENQLEEVDFCDYMDTQRNIHCRPRYKMGEVLYLKEPTAKAKVINDKQIYAYLYGCNGHKGMISQFKWENKLFMPADRARAFIRIIGIKCERLMDISAEDVVQEGVEIWAANNRIFYKAYGSAPFSNGEDFKGAFFQLFRFANKIKPTAEIGNPWVFCYSFEYLPNYQINK